jgi:glycine/D-amino acid oxidase-like deaminating enzyme
MADTSLSSWDISNPPTSPRNGPSRRVLIVGAGVAGIATAKTFLHSRPAVPHSNLVILESHSSLGGVWADGKAYPGLASNGPRGLYGWFWVGRVRFVPHLLTMSDRYMEPTRHLDHASLFVNNTVSALQDSRGIRYGTNRRNPFLGSFWRRKSRDI